MVIGSGLIAKEFSIYKNIENVLIFASGVSNSSCKDVSEFKRERDLLTKTLQDSQDKKIVYFSTCSIYDDSLKESSLYIKHKLEMEQLIIDSGISFLIVRISNPVGNTQNPHTLLNYLYSHIKQNLLFDIFIYARRNLMDIQDIFRAVDFILKNNLFENEIINIANTENIFVLEIVEIMESLLGTSARFNRIENGGEPKIDVSNMLNIYEKLGIHFGEEYYRDILIKYY